MRGVRAGWIAAACAVSACQRAAAPVLAPQTPPPMCVAPVAPAPTPAVSPPAATAPAAEPPKPIVEKPAPAPPQRAPDDPFAHRLQLLYVDHALRSKSNRAPLTEAQCDFGSGSPRTQISEISIERTACQGGCEVYSLTLHADGSVEYYGVAFTQPLGMHHGVIDTSYFEQLARLAEDINWFGLETSYSCATPNFPSAYVSLVKNNVRKTIRHYDPLESGPPRLYFFEQTLDGFMRFIEWTD